ncbi:MAG: hypothetical protein ACPHP7_01425 [Planctomycetota bacterium]
MSNMSVNDNLQNCLVQLVEAFEQLQGQLEEKHFGKVMEDPNEFDNAPDEVKEQLDTDFKETMVNVFEGLEEQNHITLDDLEAISHILLDTLEIVAPSVEAEESDVE